MNCLHFSVSILLPQGSQPVYGIGSHNPATVQVAKIMTYGFVDENFVFFIQKYFIDTSDLRTILIYEQLLSMKMRIPSVLKTKQNKKGFLELDGAN